jgi:Zn-dependent protease
LPLPPLDGGRVAVGLLPPRLGWALSRVEPYGFFVLIALLATGTLSLIISPLVRWVGNAVWTLVGL